MVTRKPSVCNFNFWSILPRRLTSLDYMVVMLIRRGIHKIRSTSFSKKGSGATYEDQFPHMDGPQEQWRRFFTVYDVIGDAICFFLFEGKPLIDPTRGWHTLKPYPCGF
ncbi:hypothetical protein F383_20248 [Gossypium arboreum]|uniref:Uncharacterized protein n=1 Tax=Gossypium arboreum TaxID=29729 RepID=A0A0B0NNA3_GOSAR|nr:hypothetical protein F383_20248 [Gossypium arboreum]